MFGFDPMWVLLLVLVGVAGIGWYKARDLITPRKEWVKLQYSLIIVGVLIIFASLNQPVFYHYSYVPEKFDTLEDAREMFKDQDAKLEKITDELQRYQRNLDLIFLALIAALPSVLGFAKVVIPKAPGERDEKEYISIFGDDNDQTKG